MRLRYPLLSAGPGRPQIHRATALTYGVAVGAVEVDRMQHFIADMPSLRAARWKTLALIVPGAGPALRATLRERHGCKVSTNASLRACEAIAVRLVSSVSAARMAELAAA